MAKYPNRFYFFSHQNTQSIIIPSHTSENRKYIPIGFLDENSVITNSAQAIYDSEPWIFSLVSSRMHMVWVRAVCGSLESRIRYSNVLGYLSFIFFLFRGIFFRITRWLDCLFWL